MDKQGYLKEMHINLPIETITKIRTLVGERYFDNQSEALRYLLDTGIELWEKRDLCKDKEFVNMIIPKEDTIIDKKYTQTAKELFDSLSKKEKESVYMVSKIETKGNREQINKMILDL